MNSGLNITVTTPGLALSMAGDGTVVSGGISLIETKTKTKKTTV